METRSKEGRIHLPLSQLHLIKNTGLAWPDKRQRRTLVLVFCPLAIAWAAITHSNILGTSSGRDRESAVSNPTGLTVPPQADPRATTGAWTPTKQWPHRAIHTHLLPTGKVIWYPSDDLPTLWDPITDATAPAQNAGYNIFCTGHSLMPDGRLFLAGGHIQDYWGLPNASTYNSSTNTWTQSCPI